MRILVNDSIPILGVDDDFIRMILQSLCKRCLHHANSHTEQGCQIEQCVCNRGFTTYLLFSDPEMAQLLITEGLIE